MKISPRLALVIIAALFAFPLVAAWLMYSGAIEFRPVETRNFGTLVQPPEPMLIANVETLDSEATSLAELREHWIVVYMVPDPCLETCLQQAAALRQVHRAAGRNQSRIRLLLLGRGAADYEAELRAVYPDFVLAGETGPELAKQFNGIAALEGAVPEKSLYLVDPLGNIMMFYAADFDPNDLKKDLKRILTWSKLDE
ncbi:MAG: hypothetical protein HKO85_04320 [Xanthomonadales bacterium]|nr:hypothetical protein [Gammaproteobacteria bacterium]MBT8056327.1 hypothetical protein [Gammaproteobacteria bacterium]NNJ80144.1 hypothetical protein [Xanthomonadales bacterium]NNL04492.1 hypothetical protein [Xanthomonadales bacterium]